MSERQDDIVWRVRTGDQWLYLYILLEFQSGVDRWMALRMQVYIGLLYQDLVRRGELSPQAMLPAVLPLVFYNGKAAWNASQDLGCLIMPAPPGLADFQASQRYFLIDQWALDPVSLAAQRSVLALLFRLELSEMPDVVSDVLPLLMAWLGEDAQGPLRRDVALWVEQLFSREFKGAPFFGALKVEEANAMRGRKFETWTDAVEDRGLQRGLKQGLEQGRELARERLRGILERALVKRYGSLPVGVAAQIEHAPMDELETWIGRAMDADSIDALFGPQAAQRQPQPPTFWAT